jgi:hypothetical protein
MDYFVPNFGLDENVATTWNSLDVAEAIRQHRWEFHGYPKKGDPPTEYNGKPDLDDDIEMTQGHMAAAEKKLGKWTWNALQVDADSDVYENSQIDELMRQHTETNPAYTNPIALAKLTSDPIFGTLEPVKDHEFGTGGRKIVQYPDPEEQGLDEDILFTKKNIGSSEKYWKHSWNYNLTSKMPNFAIPGKPEYDGENRTSLKSQGSWHIPFTAGKTSAPAAALSVKANDSSNASNTSSLAHTVQPTPAAPVTATPVLKKSDNQTAAEQKPVSKAQMRESLTNTISQLQAEIQEIWKLQQEKENKMHALQQELMKEAEPIAEVMRGNKLSQKKHKHHHHHHHHHKAPKEAAKVIAAPAPAAQPKH